LLYLPAAPYLLAEPFQGWKQIRNHLPMNQWTNLLQKHVNPDGWVNYDGFIKDSLQLNNYLQQIESNYPNEKNWSREQILAYWINAYNAYTVQIVIRNYPVASIKDIKTRCRIS
jgi:hypothetical protein